MENLLIYLISVLFKHNVTNVFKHDGGAVLSWTFELENNVYFTLDKYDLSVICSLYEERKPRLNDYECEGFEKAIKLCV